MWIVNIVLPFFSVCAREKHIVKNTRLINCNQFKSRLVANTRCWTAFATNKGMYGLFNGRMPKLGNKRDSVLKCFYITEMPLKVRNCLVINATHAS